jgi:hypothetical protein
VSGEFTFESPSDRRAWMTAYGFPPDDDGSDGAGRGQEGGKEALGEPEGTLGHTGGSAGLTDALDREAKKR